MSRIRLPILATLTGLALACGSPSPGKHAFGAPPVARFELAQSCIVCHNGLVTPAGEDISFGAAWRASMMANSARDPYWHAAVRREVIDHPTARAAIEAECSKCHMPMAHVQAEATGVEQTVFEHIAGEEGLSPNADPFATDGVSCSLCHQISAERLGERDSFTGGFVISAAAGTRPMFGPYEVDQGHATVMESAIAAKPTAALHMQRSELCATCHSLYTHALDESGRVIGELPEQVPYEEWLHSEFRTSHSCQACHMPVVEAPTAITSIMGPLRTEVSRHDFRGANFFVLGMLSRYRSELGVAASPLELSAAIARTRAFLQEHAARVTLARLERQGGRLEAEVVVENLAGHKLPTAYPSRRIWLRVGVRDASGRLLFESGQLSPTGAIKGNDNDEDPALFEPHHTTIRSAEDVQVYEAILGDPAGRVTTGLLTAVRYLKDNRVLPRGFDKRRAPASVAVYGGALADANFAAGADRIHYVVDLGEARGPFSVEAEIWYQPIAYRWAMNLRSYDAFETQRFVRYYEALATGSAQQLAAARAITP